MYCMRDEDKWWCVEDSTYLNMHRTVKDLTDDIKLYKRNGKPYVLNKDGVYEEVYDE